MSEKNRSYYFKCSSEEDFYNFIDKVDTNIYSGCLSWSDRTFYSKNLWRTGRRDEGLHTCIRVSYDIQDIGYDKESYYKNTKCKKISYKQAIDLIENNIIPNEPPEKKFKFKMLEEVIYKGEKTKIIGIDEETVHGRAYVVDAKGYDWGSNKANHSRMHDKWYHEEYISKEIRVCRVYERDLEKIPQTSKLVGLDPTATCIADASNCITRHTLPPTKIDYHDNRHFTATTTFNTSQPTTMTKIQERLNAKYFTDELIEETADLIEQANVYTESLRNMERAINDIIDNVRYIRENLSCSVENSDIKRHEECAAKIQSALKELGSKEVTQLLAINAKRTPKKETTISSILPNQ